MFYPKSDTMLQFPVANQLQITNEYDSNIEFDFSHSFRPTYVVSRIFGQLPFSIVYHPNGDVHRPVINKLDALWFLVSISVFFYIMFSTFEFINMEENSIKTFTDLCYIFVFVTSSTLGLSSIVFDMCFRFKFVDNFKRMAIFDKKASSNKWNWIFRFFFHE